MPAKKYYEGWQCSQCRGHGTALIDAKRHANQNPGHSVDHTTRWIAPGRAERSPTYKTMRRGG